MIKVCDICGDTPLEDDRCPVCSQLVLYDWGNGAYPPRGKRPLTIYRGRLVTASAPGFYFRGKQCGVVAETETEYLTACGDVVRKGCSVHTKRPDCPDCKKALRASLTIASPPTTV